MPPHIYTIAPDRPFLATLAQGLLALAGGDPLSLTRVTVLLPTRRSARSLREAFLRLTAEGSDPGAPLLLPRLRPIGDLDDDEIALGLGDAAGAEDPTLAIPPAIPELRRRLLLTQLVLRWSEACGDGLLLPGQAAALAAALARLLDAAASEEASFDRLRELVPDDLARSTRPSGATCCCGARRSCGGARRRPGRSLPPGSPAASRRWSSCFRRSPGSTAAR